MTDELASRFLAGLGSVPQPGEPQQDRVFEKGQSGQAPACLGPACLGLAVSGGGDSVAMLHLAVRAGLWVRAVTVDHGLRAESAAEAAGVGALCAGLGVPHEVLRWTWDRRGNVQDAARRARRGLIGDWARGHALGAVALGHTRDDVAETFVMRLARGAGVDGLSAMSGRWREGGVTWVRPLLQVSRAGLRDYLRGVGAVWVEDPSNDNDRFDRVKTRKVLGVLRPLGISTERLAEVAQHLAEARAALEQVTDAAALRVLVVQAGAVRLDVTALAGEAAEVQRRLIVRVIGWIAPAEYGPRGAAVQSVLARLMAGKPTMLAGCRFVLVRGTLWAFREAGAVAGRVSGPDQVWDGRWRIEGEWPPGAEMRALGEGIALCVGWRATGLPRAALMASPALWLGPRLIAAPHADFGPGYSAKSLDGAASLHHSAISH